MKRPVPPEPGTAPLPPGTIRLYHYTNAGDTAAENTAILHQIEDQGILQSHAKGETYGEPSVVWASAKPPHSFKNFVEFWAKPSQLDIGSGHFRDPEHPTAAEIAEWNGGQFSCTLYGDVKPEQIIAAHEPWHHTYRYLDDSPASVDMLNETPSFRVNTGIESDYGIARWFADHPGRDKPNTGQSRSRLAGYYLLGRISSRSMRRAGAR